MSPTLGSESGTWVRTTPVCMCWRDRHPDNVSGFKDPLLNMPGAPNCSSVGGIWSPISMKTRSWTLVGSVRGRVTSMLTKTCEVPRPSKVRWGLFVLRQRQRLDPASRITRCGAVRLVFRVCGLELLALNDLFRRPQGCCVLRTLCRWTCSRELASLSS